VKPPLRVVSSMATRALLAVLVDDWHRDGGARIEVESVGGVVAARRVAAGEPFDAVVLAADALERLVADGHVVAASRIDLARSPVAVAVAKGRPWPRIGDADALRAAVLASGRIALSTGPSGAAVEALFARWDLGAAFASRLVQAPPGVPVAALLARGDAELGFQQWSELMDAPGVEVVGPMPPGCEIVTTFTAGSCSGSVEREAVEALLAFFASPSADGAKRRHGMEPVRA
jgi:molybdate transport system substrate-binding protein